MNTDTPPPPLSAEDIEARYQSVVAGEALIRDGIDQALTFIHDVAASLPGGQGAALFDNFRRFLERSPTEEAVWQSLEPIADRLRAAGTEGPINRHRDRIAQARLTDFVARLNDSGGQRILFVAHKPYFTILRQALHLRAQGFSVFLACLSPIPETLAPSFAKAFNATVATNGAWLMARLLDTVRADLIHVQCFRWFFWLGRLAIERRGAAKVICEFYDVTSLIAPRDAFCRVWPADEVDFDFAMERDICRGADVVITRLHDRLNDKLRQRWGAPSRVDQFWPYPCPEFSYRRQPRSLSPQDPIRVVYPGNVVPRDEAHPKGMFPQHGLLDVCEKLLQQGIYVDLLQDPHLPIDLGNPAFADYARALARYPNFHLQAGVAPDRLAERLAPYDFALMSFRLDFSATWRYPDSFSHGMGTKLFSNTEAGLPVIMAAEWEYMAEIVRRENLGIVVSWQEMDEVGERIRAFDYRACLDSINRYVAEYGMDKQIGRLIEIYDVETMPASATP